MAGRRLARRPLPHLCVKRPGRRIFIEYAIPSSGTSRGTSVRQRSRLFVWYRNVRDKRDKDAA